MTRLKQVLGDDAYVVSHNGDVIAGEFASEGEAMLWCSNQGLVFQCDGGTLTLRYGYTLHKFNTINVDAIYKKGAKNDN